MMTGERSVTIVVFTSGIVDEDRACLVGQCLVQLLRSLGVGEWNGLAG